MSRDFGAFLILGSAVTMELALAFALSGVPRYVFASLSTVTGLGLVLFVLRFSVKASRG